MGTSFNSVASVESTSLKLEKRFLPGTRWTFIVFGTLHYICQWIADGIRAGASQNIFSRNMYLSTRKGTNEIEMNTLKCNFFARVVLVA